MNIFKTIIAGDSATWHDQPWLDSLTRTQLTNATWSLTYRLRGPSQLDIAATPDGYGWLSVLAQADSAKLQPGTYVWSAVLTNTAERRTIEGGTLTVGQDLTTVTTPIETRTVAQKALADCEAALATFSSSNGKIKSYSIGGRQTEFHALADLMHLRDFWQTRVNAECVALAQKNGRPDPRNKLVRF